MIKWFHRLLPNVSCIFDETRQKLRQPFRLHTTDTDAIRYNQNVINTRFNDYVFLGDSDKRL